VRLAALYKNLVALKPVGFWPGFVIGIFYFSYILWWFWSASVYLSLLLGTNGGILVFLIILPTFVITVAGVSLFWGFFSYTIYNFKEIRPIFLPLFYAGTFVLLEYLRTWFVGILLYGDGGLLGANWTFGNPAYLFASVGPIRESASYWGIYGVDFLIIFIVTATVLLIRTERKQKMAYIVEIISAIAVIVLFVFFIPAQAPDKKISASIIQTENPVKISYPPEEFLSDFSKKNELLRDASKKSDIVIFPESADFSKTLSNFLDPASIPKYFSGLSPNNILIVDSNRVPEQAEVKSKVILIDSHDGIVASYDKKLLTPGGEYFPYVSRLTLWAFGHVFKNDLTLFEATFTRGTGSNSLYYKDDKIKLLVCSDVISPSMAREGDLDFMLNLRNLAVFGGNSLIEHELLSMARFRAAENGKYLLISSNFGHSYIINNRGGIELSTNSRGYQILTGDIVLNQTRTWYNKLGDWPILMVSLLIFGLGLIKHRNANQDKNFNWFSRTSRRVFGLPRI